jgi:hypothetical protein
MTLTRYGRNCSLLTQTSGRAKRFVSARRHNHSKDAFIVPLSTETKRDPQYMRVSEPSITLRYNLEFVLWRVRYPIAVIDGLKVWQRAGHDPVTVNSVSELPAFRGIGDMGDRKQELAALIKPAQ